MDAHNSTTRRCVRTGSSFNVLALLIAFIALMSVVSAAAVSIERESSETILVDPTQASTQRRQLFADLGARRVMERAAQFEENPEEDREEPASSSIPSSTSSAGASGPTTTVLPQPFDTTLGNNFTSDACPRFFNRFLSDETFRSCYPFSLLLQTSHGFFEAEKNFFQTTVALEAGCSANYEVCSDLMQSLATEIKTESACMGDYNAENQLVMQAYNGLIAYPVMYQAACMQDDHGDYCFANAITRRDNASLADAYSYLIPLGTMMPVGNRPSCSDCLKSTMAIYRSYASNETQPLSHTYSSAAQQVNMACGPDWVSNVIDKASSSAPSLQSSVAGLLIPLLAATLFVLF